MLYYLKSGLCRASVTTRSDFFYRLTSNRLRVCLNIIKTTILVDLCQYTERCDSITSRMRHLVATYDGAQPCIAHTKSAVALLISILQ